MTTFTLILSIYSTIISTFLFGRWMRLFILRRRAKRIIEVDRDSIESKEFLAAHPPIPIPQSLDEIELDIAGEVVRGFEAELERAEIDEIEDTVEEREYQEEKKIEQSRQRRR